MSRLINAIETAQTERRAVLMHSSHEVLAEAFSKAIGGMLLLDTHERELPVKKHIIHLGGGPYLDLAVVVPASEYNRRAEQAEARLTDHAGEIARLKGALETKS